MRDFKLRDRKRRVTSRAVLPEMCGRAATKASFTARPTTTAVSSTVSPQPNVMLPTDGKSISAVARCLATLRREVEAVCVFSRVHLVVVLCS